MATKSREKKSDAKTAKAKKAKHAKAQKPEPKQAKKKPDAKKAKAEKPRATKAQARQRDAQTATSSASALITDSYSDTLRVGAGFVLADLDARATPGFTGSKEAGQAALEALDERLSELQERLYAESRGGGNRSLLLVLQGMDTSGKGGIMRHVVGLFDPQGVRATAFKAPTAEEKRHPFLWRITNALPEPGKIGVFDRSHYEDVLIVRVHDLVPRAQWSRRYAQINAWEKKVTALGTTIVKVMLHVSPQEQKARLAERLARPDKHWKFNPGDIDERAHWPAYQEAYQAMLDKCSTDVAPWHVVPADRKWYARLAVANLVLEALTSLDPQWPPADFDVAEQQARLDATP